ncbi:MAG: UDP-N-acetylenolpyruvoylglucosamine reductase [Phycisphaerae bacterium]|nr:UDP-N-acetylenolpyruvoylglucosamine reductase [Phycisphaerae bacterium]
MAQKFQSTFFGGLDVDFEHDAQIGAMTNFAIGGRADVLVTPRSTDALSLLMRRCHNSGTPVHILGKGQNLLVDDIGVEGVIVHLAAECFKTHAFRRNEQQDTLHAMAGADLATVLMDSTRRGFEGLTSMAGIPATIGGAIRMNAGGKYGKISDHLETVTCLLANGDLVTYSASELEFDYRTSSLPAPVVLSASFAVEESDPVEVRKRVKEIFKWKKTRQPLAESSAGCAFKNPLNNNGERVSAGLLIDQSGLKGLTVGGASVSEHHANFIVTSPSATARHVIDLMDEIQMRVLDATGIQLHNEVVIWSRDEATSR